MPRNKTCLSEKADRHRRAAKARMNQAAHARRKAQAATRTTHALSTPAWIAPAAAAASPGLTASAVTTLLAAAPLAATPSPATQSPAVGISPDYAALFGPALGSVYSAALATARHHPPAGAAAPTSSFARAPCPRQPTGPSDAAHAHGAHSFQRLFGVGPAAAYAAALGTGAVAAATGVHGSPPQLATLSPLATTAASGTAPPHRSCSASLPPSVVEASLDQQPGPHVASVDADAAAAAFVGSRVPRPLHKRKRRRPGHEVLGQAGPPSHRAQPLPGLPQHRDSEDAARRREMADMSIARAQSMLPFDLYAAMDVSAADAAAAAAALPSASAAGSFVRLTPDALKQQRAAKKAAMRQAAIVRSAATRPLVNAATETPAAQAPAAKRACRRSPPPPLASLDSSPDFERLFGVGPPAAAYRAALCAAAAAPSVLGTSSPLPLPTPPLSATATVATCTSLPSLPPAPLAKRRRVAAPRSTDADVDSEPLLSRSPPSAVAPTPREPLQPECRRLPQPCCSAAVPATDSVGRLHVLWPVRLVAVALA